MKQSQKRFLIDKIKGKKELSGLEDSVVKDFLDKVLEKYPSAKTEADAKIIVSETRENLRKITGRFQKSTKKREGFLKLGNIENLLKTHSSTAERNNIYPNIKRLISEINPSSILDLGCGLNPIALASKKIKYFASDIKKDELDLVEEYFDKNKIPGKVFVYDLRKVGPDLPEVELCLIFKVLDILGENNHSLAKKILQSVKCKKFLVSFSTRKLSGKPMSHPERKWFERILGELSLGFEKIYFDNEVFYLIKV